jgi:hypothetical protein
MDCVPDWAARAESIPKYLDETIKAESKKRYSSPCWLVVDLNIGGERETEAAIKEVKARYASSFEAISVLWKEQLY